MPICVWASDFSSKSKSDSIWFLEDFVFGRAGIDLEDYLHVFAHVYIYICIPQDFWLK